jgi:hypothetical protein
MRSRSHTSEPDEALTWAHGRIDLDNLESTIVGMTTPDHFEPSEETGIPNEQDRAQQPDAGSDQDMSHRGDDPVIEVDLERVDGEFSTLLGWRS